MRAMKGLIIFTLLVLLSGVGLSLSGEIRVQEPDMLEVNHILHSIVDNWPAAQNGELPESEFTLTFLDRNQSLHNHIQNRDTLIPLVIDGDEVGMLVIYNETAEELALMESRLIRIFYIQATLLFILILLYSAYQYKTLLSPFKKLERFAGRVAAGDLEAPLAMDSHNRFGAFSESFDLMREQLAVARENERLANVRKKELVASLSHDIKTPAASIKVIAELYAAKHGQPAEMAAIISKVDQIDLLITNMFSATLEELEQLKVTVQEVSTVTLAAEIHEADYGHRIKKFELPDCVLSADPLRLRQMIDNIIGNSYKYADTDIEVSAYYESSDFYVLQIRDFGNGVSQEEISLLSEKFYRANNAQGKNGTGLGLYLSAYFMGEMGGFLTFENENGFTVKLHFPI